MIELDHEQQEARAWFEALRDRICAEFEAIENEAGGKARFDFTPGKYIVAWRKAIWYCTADFVTAPR